MSNKLIFNENLLSKFILLGYNKEKLDIVKWVLFSIEQDLKMSDTLTNKSTLLAYGKTEDKDIEEVELITISWKDTILKDVQDIVKELLKESIIIKSYSPVNCRFELVRPLYVEKIQDLDFTDEFINECRKPFMASYCNVTGRASNKNIVAKNLTLLLEENTEIEKDLIPVVLKQMVDDRLQSGDPNRVTSIINFLNVKKDPERVDFLQYYEAYKSGKRIKPVKDETSRLI